MKYAWVTLLATDNFIQGAILLNNSLKKVNTKYPLFVIATNNLKKETLMLLEEENIPYRIFPYLSFFCDGDRNMKYWEGKVDQTENVWWNCTFSKIYMFLFTEFEKICFLDADIELIKNCDNYFDFPAPAAFCYPNSEGMAGGTIIVEPNIESYLQCLSIGVQEGVVNDEMIWHRWYPNFIYEKNHILPYEDFCGDDINKCKLIHYDGPNKPWL